MSDAVPAAPAPKPGSAARSLVSCLLAWFLPGLGHVYLGRKGRGAVFCVVVLATFGLGIASDGAASLVDRGQALTYLATFDNVATGPIELLSRQRTYGRIVYLLPREENHPERVELTGRLRDRVRSVTYEYGNAFLLTAGLMNILLILDTFDIAVGRKD
ncbi:MAG: hypothetical protein HY510_08450 [Acidobacteria bacterium]|nr:hypothetical protein [Acidobacteriota bacterium]